MKRIQWVAVPAAMLVLSMLSADSILAGGGKGAKGGRAKPSGAGGLKGGSKPGGAALGGSLKPGDLPKVGGGGALGGSLKPGGLPQPGSGGALGGALKPGGLPQPGSGGALGGALKPGDLPKVGGGGALGGSLEPGSSPLGGKKPGGRFSDSFGKGAGLGVSPGVSPGKIPGGRFSDSFGKGTTAGPLGDKKPGRFGGPLGVGPSKPGEGLLGRGSRLRGDGNPRFPGATRPAPGEAAGAAADAAGAAAEAASSAAAAASDAASAASQAANNYNYDYDIDVDADVDVDGWGWGDWPGWGAAPPYAYPYAVPAYAAAYGIVPSYYSWYYPPASSASVTYAVPVTGTMVEQVVTTYSATGEIAQDGAAEAQPYSDSVTSAMESLQQNPDASTRMQHGTQLFKERKYADAEEQFRQAIPLDPDNGLPRFSQAHAMFALGNYQDSSYNIRRGLDLMPDWVSSGNDIRALYGSQQDFADHHASLSAHLRNQPDDGEAMVVKGYVEFFGGNLESSKTTFKNLAAARPDDPIGPHFLNEIDRIEAHLTNR